MNRFRAIAAVPGGLAPALTLVLALCLAQVLSGCASMPEENDFVVRGHQVHPEEHPDAGVIYFYRRDVYSGRAYEFYIYEGEEVVGGLRSGGYFFVEAEPGKHTYWTKTDVKGPDSVTIRVEPGGTYYVEGAIAYGLVIGRAVLRKVPDSMGEKSVGLLPYVVLEEAD